MLNDISSLHILILVAFKLKMLICCPQIANIDICCPQTDIDANAMLNFSPLTTELCVAVPTGEMPRVVIPDCEKNVHFFYLIVTKH